MKNTILTAGFVLLSMIFLISMFYFRKVGMYDYSDIAQRLCLLSSGVVFISDQKERYRQEPTKKNRNYLRFFCIGEILFAVFLVMEIIDLIK